MKQVRGFGLTTLSMIFAVAIVACAKSDRQQSPAARLVQTELRREFNTRHLDVWEKSRDTLQIELTGGRIVSGPSGKTLISRIARGTLARRAIQLLAPDSQPGSHGVTTVVVDLTNASRFGPFVFGRKHERMTYRVDSLFEARGAPSWAAKERANAVVTLEPPADSVR